MHGKVVVQNTTVALVKGSFLRVYLLRLTVFPQDWMLSWRRLNPQWQHWFWTDEDIDKFISTRFPNFKPIFTKYKLNIQRADVFRCVS